MLFTVFIGAHTCENKIIVQIQVLSTSACNLIINAFSNLACEGKSTVL